MKKRMGNHGHRPDISALMNEHNALKSELSQAKKNATQHQQKNNQIVQQNQHIQQQLSTIQKQAVEDKKKLVDQNKTLQTQLGQVQKNMAQQQQQNQVIQKQLTNVEKQALEDKKKYEAELKRISEKQEAQIKELNNLKDVNKIKQAEQKIFLNFLTQLKSFSVMNPLPKSQGYRYVAIIGENSAGKSSLLNYVLGLKLEVGIDDTTQKIEKVHVNASSKLAYFDSPGLNQTINITHAECLKAFYTIDIMFIATSVTFKNVIRSIQVMNKINPPKLFLVRNQCDRFESDAELMNCKEKDKKVLLDSGVKRPILYVSTRRGDDFMDNAQFKKLVKGQ